MLQECAYNELLNSQLISQGNEDYHFGMLPKKYIGKRSRETKDWTTLEQGTNMSQLLKECKITKVERLGADGHIKHVLKVRTPLDSLRFEEGE